MPYWATCLELHDQLVEERQKVIQLPHIRVLQQASHQGWDEWEDLCIQTHYHTVHKLPHTCLHMAALNRGVQSQAKQLQEVGESRHTTALFHGL